MSVLIESATIGADTEKRLLLGNAQWAATISAGTSWNRLRIAARMALDDTGSDITGTPRLYLGMMSSPAVGMTNGPLNAVTDHFVGFVSASASFSRITVPSPNAYGMSSQLLGKKVDATITLAGSTVGHRISAAPTTARQVTMVEIEKGSPNFTLRCGTFAAAPADISLTTLISSLEDPTFTSAVGGTMSQSANVTTLAVTEATDGFLNAICIGWDRSSSKLHVSEMFYAIYE